MKANQPGSHNKGSAYNISKIIDINAEHIKILQLRSLLFGNKKQVKQF